MPEPAVQSPAAITVPAETMMKGAEYTLEKPFYADDTFIAEGEIIQYDGIPNETMIPNNAAAQNNLRLFYKANGGRTPDLALVMERAMNERPREPTIQRPGEVKTIPLTGGIQAEGLPAVAPKDPTVKHIPQPERPKYVRPIRQQGTIEETPGNTGGI